MSYKIKYCFKFTEILSNFLKCVYVHDSQKIRNENIKIHVIFLNGKLFSKEGITDVQVMRIYDYRCYWLAEVLTLNRF
jgi:hypothetical protein